MGKTPRRYFILDVGAPTPRRQHARKPHSSNPPPRTADAPTQAYHSTFLDDPATRTIGNTAVLPLRTRTRGPAETLPPLPAGSDPALPPDPSSESYDPLDEALSLFRANTFFRNFEIRGPADRLLIYAILFISEALTKIRPTMGAKDAERAVMNAALDTQFAIPGDVGFPLNQAFEAPRERGEAEMLRAYLGQVRQELGVRLLARVYAGENVPSKVSLAAVKIETPTWLF